MSIRRENNSVIEALNILAPVVYSVSVKRATISSHISSPIQNGEKIVSLADDVLSVLSSIQIEQKLT